MIDSLIFRDQERRGETGVDPASCLRLPCPRPHQVRELMPLTVIFFIYSSFIFRECKLSFPERSLGTCIPKKYKLKKLKNYYFQGGPPRTPLCLRQLLFSES